MSKFKHKSTLHCWVCNDALPSDKRIWVRHTDGLSYAYCDACKQKVEKE